MKHVCDAGSADGLAAMGALVDVTLLPHPTVREEFIAAGNMPQVAARMMVDTGADRTVIERKIAEQMGLSPVRFTPMVGVSQIAELCPVYLIALQIGAQDDRGRPAGLMEFASEIIGMNSPAAPRLFVGFLGRDFLRHLHVIYNGPKGRVELVVSSEVAGKRPGVRQPRKPKRRKR